MAVSSLTPPFIRFDYFTTLMRSRISMIVRKPQKLVGISRGRGGTVTTSSAAFSTIGDVRRAKAAAFGERASRQLLLEPMIRERIVLHTTGAMISVLMTTQTSSDRKSGLSGLTSTAKIVARNDLTRQDGLFWASC